MTAAFFFILRSKYSTMTSHLYRRLVAFSMSMWLLSSCSESKVPDNQLSEKERSEGWALLFDGISTKGWHVYNHDSIPSTWTVQQGALVCGPDIRFVHTDLVTDKEYKNFDLKLSWKINKGGNSGVFFNVAEKPENKATWSSGPECQILEASHPDYDVPVKRTGTMFNLTTQKNPIRQNPSTEWNESEIRQKDGHVEFYVNGVLTTEVDLGSQAFADSVAKSNFKNSPDFGKHISGHIALQDWQKAISFKNIKIKEL